MNNSKVWKDEELTCKPIDSYHEIALFIENPPPWRSLCQELTPHSKFLIRNMEIGKHFDKPTLEAPETFCHFDPDADDVKRHEEKKLPKTLVCHDMANGYHDDSLIDGSGRYDEYTFYNWAGIDIFCYFSHHLITIPPLGWINVGHAHGVKVIGTVITEWAEGVSFWDLILSSEEEYRSFASALVTIAKLLKFDGWLLNIENKITKPELLLEFVRYLHKILHQEIPDGVLVWYDSVTVTGNLNWQNGLNEKNKDFFDACDAIFTNYSWTEKDIAASVEAAGDRVLDVFIGIDVWGRNFYGGGQFNTQEAIKVVHEAGCSIAIFAPAWTHEAIEDSDLKTIGQVDPINKFESFILRDRALWGSLWPYLNTRVPCQLPFQTSFCRGQGKKRRLYGEVLCPVPWFNLRHMQYQPNAAHGPHGYMLSTLDNIIKVSRKALVTDNSGILKYRDSFFTNRMELHSIKNHSRTGLMPLLDSMAAISEEVSEEEVDEKTVQPQEDKPKLKRKIKDAFKHLFRLKSRKTDDSEKADNTHEEEEDIVNDERPGTSKVTGRSFVSMSVNIKLGEKIDKTRWELAVVPDEKECLELYLKDSFTGGACLQINPRDTLSPEHRFTRLFFCDFRCDDSLIICVVTKTLKQYSQQCLNVVLFMENAAGQDLEVTLVGRAVVHKHVFDANASGTVHLYPLIPTQTDFRDLQKYLLLYESRFYVPVENSYNWNVRYYEVAVPGSRVTSINCRTEQEDGGILLGHLGLCSRRDVRSAYSLREHSSRSEKT